MSDYNNPANIEHGQGYAGELDDEQGNPKLYAGRFVTFSDKIFGVRAVFRDLMSKSKQFDGDIAKMISKFAPDFENPTNSYVEFIKGAVGKPMISTDEDLKKAVAGVIKFENGVNSEIAASYLEEEVFNNAEALSKISLPRNITLEEAYKRLPASKLYTKLDGVTKEASEHYNYLIKEIME